jgi:LysM repeat protein
MTSTPNHIDIPKACSHLGFINDKNTAMGYPSAQNYCHNCEPPRTPRFSHQRDYCLSKNHNECPIFASTEMQRMPRKSCGTPEKVSGIEKAIVWFFSISLAMLFIALLWMIGPRLFSRFSSSNHVTPVASTISQPSSTATRAGGTSTPTPYPTVTKTVPAATNTPVIMRELETPFGEETELIVHQVKEGESLPVLAATYSTTVDAIRAINVLEGTLQANSLVVIPVGRKDVTAFPRLKIEKVDQDGITLNDVAETNHLDAKQLSRINRLPETFSFKIGDWVLLPVTQDAP